MLDMPADIYTFTHSFSINCAGVKIIGHDSTVMKGGNATLFCHLTETEKTLTHIVWQKQTRGNPDLHTFFIIHKDGKTEHKNDLQDNVTFIGSFKEKNGSIQLLGMSLLDDGIYTCIFNTFPIGNILTNISVKVHGKTANVFLSLWVSSSSKNDKSVIY